MRRRAITANMIKADVLAGLTIDEMMVKHGCARGTVIARRNAAGFKGFMQPAKPRSGPPRLARHEHKHRAMAGPKEAMVAGRDAVRFLETMFPTTVGDHATILVSGFNETKLGRKITKGQWKGSPIYSLALEERKTCPVSCKVLATCYGNRMPMARRHRHGSEFEARLWAELAVLDGKHPDGFAVRLHTLGDFYSTDYVMLWAQALKAFPALRVFGFTARWEDDIGQMLQVVATHSRFRIRFSGAPVKQDTSIVVSPGENIPDGAILCPWQTGKTRTCGTCALCWGTHKPIAFWSH